jgi:hypothetical protein
MPGKSGPVLMMKSHAIISAPIAKQNIPRESHPLPHQRAVVKVNVAGIGEAVLINFVKLRPTDGKEV